MQQQASKHTLIVGLGITGLACARFLKSQNIEFDLCDSRTTLANAEAIQQEFVNSQLYLGEFDGEQFCTYKQILVSPGVALSEPALIRAQQAGVFIRGDVDLFVEHNRQKIIAITGSNGKTTVTSLVAHVLSNVGVKVAVGGNIGTPVLELLAQDYEVVVLELSSFQLETTHQLEAHAACILNLCADHMDRYSDLNAYLQAKLRIFIGAKNRLLNLDDSALLKSVSTMTTNAGVNTFSVSEKADFYMAKHAGEDWLYQQNTPLIACSQLKIKGQHNMANALAALGLCAQLGYQAQDLLEGLQCFTGLAHRCEYLGKIQGVDIYNDSKGTNVGATLAAIKSVGVDTKGKLWLLAGGVGKEQDFSPLTSVAVEHLAGVYLFGAQAELIAQAIEPFKAKVFTDLDSAYQAVQTQLQSGDALLFSPACASFDQYPNYMARGDAFKQLVRRAA